MEQKDLDELRQKRMRMLLGTWDALVKHNKLDAERLTMSPPLANEVIEYYIADNTALKERYRIKDRIQLHKVAGLTTSAILRFRPIIPLVHEFNSYVEIYANEILAIYHGLAICGEFAVANGHLKMIDEDWFEPWMRNFVYLLHHRNYTSEGLIFVYETICRLKFPSNLDKRSD